MPAMSISTALLFQSTLPHGERQAARRYTPNDKSFNPRSRTGSDLLVVLWLSLLGSFNPRSRTGSDEYLSDGEVYVVVSIHAPARGATMQCSGVYIRIAGFNPRSRTGSDASL